MAAEANIKLVKGTTRELRFSVADAELEPIDLTGATITYAIRSAADVTPVVEKETGDGITITDAEGGLFKVLLEPADTATVAAGDYYHEALVTLADGTKFAARNSNLDPARFKIMPAFG